MMNSLSGRFLVLTTIFVMLAEVLIFVPSVSRFRLDYLMRKLEQAQIASLARLANDMLDEELERELLNTAGVLNVVLARDEMRQLMLSSEIPEPVSATFDLREPSAMELIGDAMMRLATPENQVIRVISAPVREAGLLIEITMETAPLRAAMIDYGLRILALSAFITIVTAGLLFLAVRRLLVRPIRKVVDVMQSYAAAPEDSRRMIVPASSVRELREAEDALLTLQTELTQALRQKDRLAQLGGAVSKISHDLRNILTSSQLFIGRIEGSEDPLVRRMAPKLVSSISRAVHLCESTLAFGKAEELPPRLSLFPLGEVVADVVDSERLATEGHHIEFDVDVPQDMRVRADADQVFRVLANLVRNARQALMSQGAGGRIAISAREDARAWYIAIADNGPGLPKRARDFLFQPFQGRVSKGGSGLGLAIALELVRGHGGTLELQETGPEGTRFEICLPKGDGTL